MDLFLLAGTPYSLSFSECYVDRLSFYCPDSNAPFSLSISDFGTYNANPGFNEIPLHSVLSSLVLTPSSQCLLKQFKAVGRANQIGVLAPNDLFSAVYPASNALFTAFFMPSPYVATDAIALQGANKCLCRAFYNPSTDIKHSSSSTMEYPVMANYSLSKQPAECEMVYTGSVSINGIALPESNQGTAVYSLSLGGVKIGSQTVPATVDFSNGLSIEASSLQSFSLTLEGDSEPYVTWSKADQAFFAGYSPQDFAALTFLPLTQWQWCYNEILLPSAFYGGVFKLEFTDLPAGITEQQEELTFQVYALEEKTVSNVSRSAASPSPLSVNSTPLVLTSSPVEKPTQSAPKSSVSTPFFSNSGAGVVYPSGNAFTGATLQNLSPSFASMGADVNSSLQNAYQGFTGSISLPSMGFSIAAQNVQSETDDFPIQGDSAYIDPSLLNGKTVEFAYPFKSVQLAPGSSQPAGYLSTYPVLLNTSFQPENVYQTTPRLNAYWSDDETEWASANKSWGMDNPNLSYDYTPDLAQPYATFVSSSQAKVSLGERNAGKRPIGFQIAYEMPAGSTASLVFGTETAIPLIADGAIHSLEENPRFRNDQSPAISLILSGTIRIYSAAFTEGNWALFATTESGYRFSLDPIFKGEIINLNYWATSLTFDLINYGSSPSLPGGFALQANLQEDIDISEEEQFEPYTYIFFSNTVADSEGFFQVQAEGIDMNTGAMVDLPPSLFRYELVSDPSNSFSYFGGGWFYCSSSNASATVNAYYGGQTYPVYLS